MSDLRDYLDTAGGLPTDTLLGWLVMWSVEEFDPGITPTALEKLFDELQLDKSLMPAPPKQLDAFKKCTSEFKREIPLPDGSVASYFARDVKSDAGFVQRHIVREVRDARTRELTYTKAIECVFYRPTTDTSRRIKPDSGRTRFTVWTDVPRAELPQVEAFADHLKVRQDVLEKHLDCQRVRAVIRDYIKQLDAVQVKSSTYFIHRDKADELHRLMEFVKRLPGRCRMHLVPLVDLEDMREMVIEAFQEESAAALNKIVEQCVELKANGAVTPAAYVKLKSEFDQISNRALAYKRKLETSRDLTLAAGQLALTALVDLSHRMVDNDAAIKEPA